MINALFAKQLTLMNDEFLYHAIKDPVHGTMQFTTTENNWIKPFIDSPSFQRLRHIKQLGMGDFIFPGAVHTRFNHSLGCCYVASQIAQKIKLPPEEHQLIMIACLLHDIGHGPFSHAFEDLFHGKLIRHEAWTPFFLADYKTDAFLDAYNHCNPDYPLTNARLLSIEKMIMHQSFEKPILSDIVSSQLDADRLDYLLRDSHFCGVNYGEFDLSWMLSTMTTVDSPEGKRLGLTHKGIGVVEHYLMARRLMIRNIYLHPKKLAIEFFLIKLLAILAEEIEHNPLFLEIKNTRLGRFLSNTNEFNRSLQQREHSNPLTNPFLHHNFENYKELCDYDVFSIIKSLAMKDSTHPAIQIAKRLQTRQMPKIIRLDHANISLSQQMLCDFKKTSMQDCEDWQLALIKTPHQSYSDGDPILISNEKGTVRPLEEISLMIHAMGNKLEHTMSLCIDKAIYNDPRIQEWIQTLDEAVVRSTDSTSCSSIASV